MPKLIACGWSVLDLAQTGKKEYVPHLRCCCCRGPTENKMPNDETKLQYFHRAVVLPALAQFGKCSRRMLLPALGERK